MNSKNFDVFLKKYFDHIKSDYVNWMRDGRDMESDIQKKVVDEMIDNFKESMRFEPGRKYGRVVTDNGAHSFISLCNDDKRFPYGTIMKAATWAAPAKNFGRGNIFEEDFSRVTWTGAS
jgi:hypothetical protein